MKFRGQRRCAIWEESDGWECRVDFIKTHFIHVWNPQTMKRTSSVLEFGGATHGHLLQHWSQYLSHGRFNGLMTGAKDEQCTTKEIGGREGGRKGELRSERRAKTFRSNLCSFFLCRKLSPPGVSGHALCWDGTEVAWTWVMRAESNERLVTRTGSVVLKGCMPLT